MKRGLIMFSLPRLSKQSINQKISNFQARSVRLGGWLVGLCLLSVSPFGLAQENAIESVTTTQQGASIVVRVQMKTPLSAVPSSFSVGSPARVALDLPKTANASGKNVVEVGQGDLRSVNVVQAGDRSRVVLNLNRLLPYQTRLEGNAVLLTLDASPTAAVQNTANSAAPRTFVQTREVAAENAVRDIDFRRGADGAGRVIIDLSNTDTGVDIRQQGQTLVVEFVKTSLPQALRRRLDVLDFGTPIKSVNTFQQGDNVRMVIEPSGLWEHNAYQSDNRFVVEVKPIKEDPNKLVQGSRGTYKGEKLSLNFQNVEVRALLQVIADFTNLNIIASETVQGNITLRLKDVPWDQALDIIMQAKGLDMRKNGNVLLIAPRDELTTKEKLEFEARQQISELEPMRTEVFQLNYQKAENFKNILTDDKQRILSKRGSAVLDPRTNQLFIQDIPSKLDEIRKLVAKVDIPTRQVLIEARIVEADDRFSKNLGAKLGFVDGRLVRGQTPGTRLYDGNRVTIAGTQTGVAQETSQLAGVPPISDTNFVSLPAAGLNGFGAGQFAISIFGSSLSRFLNLELTALESDGKGKIISSPRVITADNVEALIEQGEEIPYQQATSSGATSVSFKKAVLGLKVKPQITPEGAVIMKVLVSKDSRGVETSGGPAINTRKVETEVLVENGGTVVIGGIYEEDERTDVTKVPLFGDIPIIGNLFKNTTKRANKTELLIFLTPKVISDKVSAR